MILLISVALGLCLGSIGLMGRQRSIASVLLIMGVAAGMVNIHIGAWIMQRIDVAVRGRVSSVLMLSSFGITPFPCGSRISGCVELEAHVFARWRRNVAGCRRRCVPKVGAGD
jgi:hypothetical protein